MRKFQPEKIEFSGSKVTHTQMSSADKDFDLELARLDACVDEIPQDVTERLEELIGLRVIGLRNFLCEEIEKYRTLFEKQRAFMRGNCVECCECKVKMHKEDANYCINCETCGREVVYTCNDHSKPLIKGVYCFAPNGDLICSYCSSEIRVKE